MTEAPGLSKPILPGPGASDYERYLRTDDLLALQKTPEEQSHPDELLFQTVHQSSELWLKLGTTEVARATAHVRAGEIGAALRLLRRAALLISSRSPAPKSVTAATSPSRLPSLR